MTVINTNTSSMIARDAIQRNDRAMSTAMERLSTGSRINSAKDDAAGLAISERMSAQVSGLNMAVRNANDAISLLQTADGATQEISNMLGRMRELAVQAASGTYTTTDQAALDLEFGALMDEIDRIATNTEWNGSAILAGASSTASPAATTNDLAIQLGAEASQTMALSLNSWRTKVNSDTEMSAASGTDRDGVDPATGEAHTVTVTAMANGDAVTIAGVNIKVTDAGGATAAQIKAVIVALVNGSAATNNGDGDFTVTGELTGYDTTAHGDADKIIFTNTGGRNDSVDLTVAGMTGETSGADHFTIGAAAGGAENAGAYGTGALHWGGSYTRINVTSASNAAQAITELDAAINGAAAERAKLGSYMSRLQHASDNLQNVSTNTSASRSQIADADYATETTELARTQIISQASTAMLAQANQVKQTVLSLLQ
jgi:flagellin